MSLPYLPLVAPTPILTGYLGYFAGMMALLIIPLILLVRFTTRWLWGYRSSPRIRRTLLGAWLVSAVVFIATVSFTVRNFDEYGSDTSVVHSSILENEKPLSLEVQGIAFNDHHVRKISFGNSFLGKRKLYVGESINIRLLPSTEKELKIRKKGKSRGSTRRNAKRNISMLDHSFSVVGNAISIEDYYTIDRKGKFRAQEIEFDILIPIGTVIDMKGNLYTLSRQDFEEKGNWEDDLWIMTEEGLILSEEKQM